MGGLAQPSMSSFGVVKPPRRKHDLEPNGPHSPMSIQATSLHGIRVASSRLLTQDRISLLAQGNPDPEPGHRLDKDKCKE